MGMANRRVAWILGLLALAAPAGAATPGVTVLREGPDGLTLRIRVPEPVQVPVQVPEGDRYLRITLPGFPPGSGEDPGRPDLPVAGYPFGLPEGTTARLVRTSVLASDSFQGLPPIPVPVRRIVPGDQVNGETADYRTDPAVYGKSGLVPATVAELGPVQGWRHQRIQTLVLHPVRVDPVSGRYQTIREIEVELAFRPDRAAPGPRRRPVLHDAAGWDETLDRAVVNPASARTFRSRPVAVLPRSPAQPGDTYLRVRFGGSGLARIPFSDLAAAGWPSGIPVGEVRVEEHGYDGALGDPYVVHNLARRVEDTNADGILNDGDYLDFYGFNYQDRFQPQISDSRYGYFHSYWIHAGPGGADFPVVDGYPAGTDYTPVTSYPDKLHLEQNQIYINDPKDSGVSIFPIYDSFYWLGSADTDKTFYFPVAHLAPDATFRVRARWQGKDTVPATSTHIVSLDLNGRTVLDQGVFLLRFQYIYEGTTQVAAGTLIDGINTLTVRGRAEGTANRSGAYFDWFEMTYDRTLDATDNRIQIDTGDRTGKLEYAVPGFTSPDILVLDVTDPLDIREMNGRIEDTGGSYTLKVRLTATQGTPRKVAAYVPSGVSGLPPSEHPLPPDLPQEAIQAWLPRDLIAAGQGSDYILITHPELRDAWQPLIDQRQTEEHQVFLCDVWEIYDQFAGGDKTPWAIQRFLTQAYRNWDPSPTFLLLGGNASEDYRNDTTGSLPDLVPTLMYFGNVTGTTGLELSGTDEWYVAFLRAGDSPQDVLPDMYVGRVPARTVQEVQDYVQKVVKYATMDPGDAWRNRGYFLADDQYSSSIFFNAGYCFQPAEISFKGETRAVCDSIHGPAGLSSFDCQTLFLADHLDTVSALNRHPGDSNDCPGSPGLVVTRSYTRSNLVSLLTGGLSRGCLIWEFSGHGNRNLLTHESIIEQRPGTSAQDLAKINNIDKPFVFMGYACHLCEFEYVNEKTSGNSIGEYLLLAPSRGAVGVFGSSGYEWLPTNPVVQEATSRALFWDLPRDPSTGRPRRLFGETTARALAGLVLANPSRDYYQGTMRSYQTLGDPALQVDVTGGVFQVQVDGTPWTDGTPLVGASFQDSVSVTATISDDVDLSSIRVLEAGTELPESRLQRVLPDPAQNGAQTYQVAFKHGLRLGSYDVVVEAQDWVGRVATFTLPVRMETVFKADGTLLGSNPEDNLVDPGATLEIEVTSPVPLAAEDFTLQVDGEPAQPAVAQVSDRDWVLTLSREWSPGDHRVELSTAHAGAQCLPDACPVVRSVGFRTLGATLDFVGENYVYPNPVEGDDTAIVYTLSRNATRAQVVIYTVSGRRVLRADAPTRAGRNSFHWDLRDTGGDRVANGIYLVFLEIDGTGKEHRKSALDRIAVTR